MGILRNEIKLNFTQIPNQLLFDNRLSFGARILFGYLASKPDNWKIVNQDIINTLNVSCDSIAKYFKELLNTGWISRERETDEKGQFCGGYNYTVYSKPIKTTNTITGKSPNKEKVLIRQNAGNINNTNSSSNNIINNKNNNKSKNNNINNNINETQSNIIKLEENDKLVYESYKNILEEDKNTEKKAEKPKDDTNIPKVEKDAKNEPKQKPNEEIGKDAKPKKKFVKPTIEQIKEYAKEAKLVNLDPNAFFDHFESNGWKVSGISPMKDWKAAMRTWNRRTLQFNKQDNKGRNKFYEMYQQMEEKGEE